jgi:2-iminobutanoate/2-iminopropanoate deaminase
MKKAIHIHTNQARSPVARYSQAIKVGNTLYVQGVIAFDPVTKKLVSGDISVQTNRVFESIRSILAAADMGFGNVVKVMVFLADLKAYPEFNNIYDSVFTADPPPVRTTVQAKLPFGALVEVEVIAYRE